MPVTRCAVTAKLPLVQQNNRSFAKRKYWKENNKLPLPNVLFESDQSQGVLKLGGQFEKLKKFQIDYAKPIKIENTENDIIFEIVFEPRTKGYSSFGFELLNTKYRLKYNSFEFNRKGTFYYGSNSMKGKNETISQLPNENYLFKKYTIKALISDTGSIMQLLNEQGDVLHEINEPQMTKSKFTSKPLYLTISQLVNNGKSESYIHKLQIYN